MTARLAVFAALVVFLSASVADATVVVQRGGSPHDRLANAPKLPLEILGGRQLGPGGSPVVSPDGSRIAFARLVRLGSARRRRTTDLRVVRTSGGPSRQVRRSQTFQAAFTADSARLLLTDGAVLVDHDLATGRDRPLKINADYLLAPAPSLSGREVAIVRGNFDSGCVAVLPLPLPARDRRSLDCDDRGGTGVGEAPVWLGGDLFADGGSACSRYTFSCLPPQVVRRTRSRWRPVGPAGWRPVAAAGSVLLVDGAGAAGALDPWTGSLRVLVADARWVGSTAVRGPEALALRADGTLLAVRLADGASRPLATGVSDAAFDGGVIPETASSRRAP